MLHSVQMRYTMARQSTRCRGALVMRRVESLGIKQRSKTVVVANEVPVKRFDDYRGIEVDEVLLMSGIQWRGNSRQLPVHDTENPASVRNLYGSIRNLRTDAHMLLGEIAWASDKDAQAIARRWQDGELNEFNILAQPLEIVDLLDGQQYGGVKGPADVITKWEPLSVYLTTSDIETHMP